jgi:Cu+-exporting ATPase
VLEALAGARQVAFDKTGTVTLGRPAALGARLADVTPVAEAELWALAAAVAVQVDHPLSRAVAARARECRIAFPAAEVRAIPGAGAIGTVGGQVVLLGNDRLLAQHGVLAPPRDTGHVADGRTLIHVALDGHFIGSIAVKDRPRADASEAVQRLKVMGVSSSLLSGDSFVAVNATRREIGLDDAQACMSPQAKPEYIQTMKGRGGLVVMVGDGINDAPALAAADVGIAFGSATDLARQTADVVILRDDLNEVPHLLARARRTMRIMKQNLAWALAYNGLGILLAAFGLLRPVVAAAAMVLSSLFVVGNSLRLRRDRFEQRPGV